MPRDSADICLSWSEIWKMIEESFITLGKNYQVLIEPGKGHICTGLGAFIPGVIDLKNYFIEKKSVVRGRDTGEKAFLFIFITFFEALERVIEKQDPSYRASQKTLSRRQKMYLDRILASLETKKVTLGDFEEDIPGKSDFFKDLNTISWTILAETGICDDKTLEIMLDRDLEEVFREHFEKNKSFECFDEPVSYLQGLQKVFPQKRFVEHLRQKAVEQARKRINDEFLLEQLYVAPRYGVRRFENDHFIEEVEWQLDDIMQGVDKTFEEGKKICLITAAGGMGKTSFSRMYAARVQASGERIPVMVELKNFFPPGADPTRKKAEELLGKYMKKELKLTDFDKKSFQKALDEFPFLIIYDGLDEIPEVDHIRKVIRSLTTLSGKDLRIIITSAPGVFPAEIQKEIKEFKRDDMVMLTLAELDDLRVNIWLGNWFTKVHPEVPVSHRFIFSDVKDEQRHKEVRTPFNLYMLARILIREEVNAKQFLKEEQLRKTEIHQHYIDWTIAGARYHFEEIPGQQIPGNYRILLEELAYSIFAQGKGETISEAEFVKRLPAEFLGHYEEIRKIRCSALSPFEFRRKGQSGDAEFEGNFSFLHKAFKDYLVAERVIRVFMKASLEKNEKNADRCFMYIGDRVFSGEIIAFQEELLDQLVEVSEASPEVIGEALSAKRGKYWRFADIAGISEPGDFRNIDRKIFDIAIRWMQKDQLFLSEYSHADPTGIPGKAASWRLKDPEHFLQNVRIISFLIASHLSRTKFKDAFPESGIWLKKLLDQSILETSVHLRLKDQLFGLDLRGAYMMGVNLLGANLSETNLTLTKLTGADLRGAKLRRADLRAATLNESNLNRANLIGANLFGANLAGTSMRGANLSGADLRGSFLYNPLYGPVKLQGAILEGARFRKEDLQNVDLEGVDLSKAIIEDDASGGSS